MSEDRHGWGIGREGFKTMKIELGKKYQTRFGKEVRIYAMEGEGLEE